LKVEFSTLCSTFDSKLRARIRNSDIRADIRADIGATDTEARFTMDIRGCADNLTDIRSFTDIKPISARTVRPGRVTLRLQFFAVFRRKVFLLNLSQQ